MNIAKEYIKAIKDGLNYSAVWLPTTTVSAGDVGRMIGFEYQHHTTLKDLGIQFEIVPGKVKHKFEYYSTGSVSIRIKSAGQAQIPGSSLVEAQAGINVKFSKEKAIALKLSTDATSKEIRDLRSLKDQVLAKYRKKEWDRSWVVVREVITAPRTSILVSGGKNAQIDINVQGDVGPEGLSLVNLGINPQVVNESSIAMKILAKQGATPLFKTSAVKSSWFGFRKDFKDAADKQQSKEEKIAFADVDYSDFIPE